MMRVMITGRHIEVTSALRQYVQERVKRLDRYGVKTRDVQIVLSVEKHRHMAEAVVPVNGAVIQSKVSTTEMYGSIDQLFEKISRQLVKRKEKLTERKPRTLREKQRNAREDHAAVIDVKTVRVPVPSLTLDQAVARLLEDDHPLVIFADAATKRLGVLHRSKSGSLQLVEPAD